MKNILFIALAFLSITLNSCSAGDPGTVKNYYAEAGILTPEFKNEELNKHITHFESLYNELGIAVSGTDKASVPDLSKSFSNWILKAIDFKQNLVAEDQKKLEDYLEKVNTAWNKQKNLLF